MTVPIPSAAPGLIVVTVGWLLELSFKKPSKMRSLMALLNTVEVTAGVFHKVFHQVFLQLLFILSWKLALRGHFKISKKKKAHYMP